MEEKKELSQEELERVSGGSGAETDPNLLTWRCQIGKTYYAHEIGVYNYHGFTVKKQGRVLGWGNLWFAYVYCECDEPSLTGWYVDNEMYVYSYYVGLGMSSPSDVVVTAE